jgi:hypothetical protein
MILSLAFLIVFIYLPQQGYIQFQDEAALHEYAQGVWTGRFDLIADAWAQPGTTLSYVIASTMDMEARRLTAVIFSVGTVLFTTGIALRLRLRWVWLIPALVMFQPWFYQHAAQSLGYIPLTFLLTAGVYYWLSGRIQVASFFFGLMPITQHETLIVPIFWTLYLFSKPLFNYLSDALKLNFSNPYKELDYELDQPLSSRNQRRRDWDMLAVLVVWLPYLLWTLTYSAINDRPPILFLLNTIVERYNYGRIIFPLPYDLVVAGVGPVVMACGILGLLFKLVYRCRMLYRLLRWRNQTKAQAAASGSTGSKVDGGDQDRERLQIRVIYHEREARAWWIIPFALVLAIAVILIQLKYHDHARYNLVLMPFAPAAAILALMSLRWVWAFAERLDGSDPGVGWRVVLNRVLAVVSGGAIGTLLLFGILDQMLFPHHIPALAEYGMGAIDDVIAYAREDAENPEPHRIVVFNPVIRRELTEAGYGEQLCPRYLWHRETGLDFFPQHFPQGTSVILEDYDTTVPDIGNSEAQPSIHVMVPLEENKTWIKREEWESPLPVNPPAFVFNRFVERDWILRAIMRALVIAADEHPLMHFFIERPRKIPAPWLPYYLDWALNYRIIRFEQGGLDADPLLSPIYVARYCGDEAAQPLQQTNREGEPTENDPYAYVTSINVFDLYEIRGTILFDRAGERTQIDSLTNCVSQDLLEKNQFPVLNWSPQTCIAQIVMPSGALCNIIADPAFTSFPQQPDYFLRIREPSVLCASLLDSTPESPRRRSSRYVLQD